MNNFNFSLLFPSIPLHPVTLPLRSHSPNSRSKLHKGAHTLCSTDDGHHKPLHDLNYHVRQVKNALQHFKDVISRNKLEVLPGNGTIVLESIANVHTALQPYTLNDENSGAIISATTQVYLSLGKLIKLCDEVLLSEDNTNCASLSKENVAEVVELVDNAVQVSDSTSNCISGCFVLLMFIGITQHVWINNSRMLPLVSCWTTHRI